MVKYGSLAALMILIFGAIMIPPCPIKGDSNRPDLQAIDSLKNRPATRGKASEIITLNYMLVPGEDQNRFSSSTYASLIGYITNVKHGSSETCNCHSKDKADQDIHIELSLSLTPGKIDHIVCEVNRFNKSITYDQAKGLKGKKVQIEGWLFFDTEHTQNARNTNPLGTFLWRATCWELHPVCKIKVL